MKIKLSKSQWEQMGKKAGWIKEAEEIIYTIGENDIKKMCLNWALEAGWPVTGEVDFDFSGPENTLQAIVPVKDYSIEPRLKHPKHFDRYPSEDTE